MKKYLGLYGLILFGMAINWSKTEILIALAFYFKNGRLPVDDKSYEARQLKDIINHYWELITPDNHVERSVGSVASKIVNIIALDPTQTRKGFENIGKNDLAVWEEYADDKETLFSLYGELLISIEKRDVKRLLEISESINGDVAPEMIKLIEEDFKTDIQAYGERELENSFEKMSREEFLKYLKSRYSNHSPGKTRRHIADVRDDNKTRHDKLKERYGYKCQICGESTVNEYGIHIVEVHHIGQYSLTKNDSPENIMVLCPNHHTIVHKANGVINFKENKVVYSNGKEEVIKLNTHIQ